MKNRSQTRLQQDQEAAQSEADGSGPSAQSRESESGEDESDSELEQVSCSKSAYFLKTLAKIKEDGLRPTYPLGAFCIFLQERRRELINQRTPSKFYSSSHLRHEWRKLGDKTRFQVEARSNYKEYKLLMRIWRRRADKLERMAPKRSTRQLRPHEDNDAKIKNKFQGSSDISRAGSEGEAQNLKVVSLGTPVIAPSPQDKTPSTNLAHPTTPEAEVYMHEPMVSGARQVPSFPLKDLPSWQSPENSLGKSRNLTILFQPSKKRNLLQPLAGPYQLAPTALAPSNHNFALRLFNKREIHAQSKHGAALQLARPPLIGNTCTQRDLLQSIGQLIGYADGNALQAQVRPQAFALPRVSGSHPGSKPSDLFDRLVRSSVDPAPTIYQSS